MGTTRKLPRQLFHRGVDDVQVGDLSYDSTKSFLPATGDSPSWWPIGALAAVGVIVGIFVYGHKTGWT